MNQKMQDKGADAAGADAKYYEVECAVLRELPGKPMELYVGKGKWEPYKGDLHRIKTKSNAMTLDEVKDYMD